VGARRPEKVRVWFGSVIVLPEVERQREIKLNE
jgi:hypothetical protein